MAIRITDKIVKSLEAPAKGSVIIWDTDISGFGVRISAEGTIAFALNYRNANGRERRYTIGRYGTHTVASAREAAKQLKRDVKGGADPVGAGRDQRNAPTVRDMAKAFKKSYLGGLRVSSRRDYERLLDNHILPVIGAIRAHAVTPDDVRRVKTRLEKKPTTGNRALAVTSKMFSWAIQQRYRPDGTNPAKGIGKYTETARERYLSQAEIARLSAVLAEHKTQNSANILRFLLFTGARSGEVFKARWADVDFERSTWRKPAAYTKQKRVHEVPLSAPALQLLAGLQQDGEWVFPGPTGGPVTTLKKSWAVIRKKAGIEDVRIHDLRHTYASILISGGASLPLVGALLGHTQPTTTARYAHLFDEPLREATELVGRAITAAGAKTAEVVEVKRG
jgi:integrase